MSPVEPSPVVIGTMGAPSGDGMVTSLRFFGKSPPPVNPEDVKTLLAAPIAARKERRLQPNFILGSPYRLAYNLFVSNRCGRVHNSCAADDFNQRISRNPFDRHAGAGWRLPGREIRSVDLVQGVVL